MKMPKVFNSMYLKWITAFVALLFVAQATTAMMSYRTVILNISEVLSDKLTQKAVLFQELYRLGHNVNENTPALLGDTDISFMFLDEAESRESSSAFDYIVSFDMTRRAYGGEIVLAHRQATFHRTPYVLFSIDGRLAILSPIFPNNELTLFVDGIAKGMAFNMVLSSLFVAGALMVIFLKIRKVTAATREVAQGNFNVELFTRATDEVGELMHNFNIMTGELRKSEYLKKDFVSSISHEFKTPITAIEGFAKLLRSESLTKEQLNEYTDIIIKETARLSNLSTNLLRLSFLDYGEIKLESAPFYIDEQIRSNILLLERGWLEKGISFEIDMDEMLYNGNEEMLSQVWINILQNAIKFSPQGGTIYVYLREHSDHVLIEITDEGPGISSQNKDKIFTRFFKDSKHNYDGVGLGLPIAKRIVEMFKGEIGFESQKGKTTFFVKLPLS